MPMLLLFAVTLSLQEPPLVTIGKAAAAPYRAAVKSCQDAEAALASGNYALAIEKAGAILDDAHIEKDRRECRLRIQNEDSTFAAPVEFFPARARGRALLARAAKQVSDGNREGALATLGNARKDLEESQGRQAPGSQEALQEVLRLAKSLESGAGDPAAARKREVDARIAQAAQLEVKGSYPEARRLFQEALDLDPGRAEVKEALERIDGKIREEAAYKAFLAAKDPARQLAAGEQFLQDFPQGSRAAEVRNFLRDLSRGAEEAEIRLRDEWRSLRDQHKYRSAIDLVRGKGASLAPEKVKQYEEQTASDCKVYIDERLYVFRLNVAPVDGTADLAGRTAEWFDRDLELPDAAEMVTTTPALDWGRAFRAALEKLRARGADPAAGETLDLLQPSWRGVAGVVPKGENTYFRVLVGLVMGPVEKRIRAILEKARSSPDEALPGLREEARALAGRLDAFDGDLGESLKGQPDGGKAWRELHPFWAGRLSATRALLEAFPGEDAEVAREVARLTDWEDPKGPFGASPREALREIEDRLRAIHDERRDRISRDGRRRLLAGAIVAATQRMFLGGSTPEEAARDARVVAYARDLKKCGPVDAAEVARHGPKVERVFALLGLR